MYNPNSKELYKDKDLKEYYEQIGNNTDYIVHPEEVMADNFSYLVTGKKVPIQPILDEIAKIFLQ